MTRMSLVSNFTQPDTQSSYFEEFLQQLDALPRIRELRLSASRRIAPTQAGRVLDLGCGIGGATFLLAEQLGDAGHVVGVDISAQLIETAKRIANGRPRVEFQVADAASLPYPTNFFDAAYTERVFLYLPDREAALAELRRVVRPDGLICLVDVDFDCAAIYSRQRELTRRITSIVAAAIPNPNSARDLPALAKRAGLRDVEVDTVAICTPFEFAKHAMSGVLQQAVQRGTLTPTELESWWSEQQQLNEAGDFLHIWIFARVMGRA